MNHKQACEAWNAVFESIKQFRLSALFLGLPTNLRVINANPVLEADKKLAAAFLREWADSLYVSQPPAGESDAAATIPYAKRFYIRDPAVYDNSKQNDCSCSILYDESLGLGSVPNYKCVCIVKGESMHEVITRADLLAKLLNGL